MTTVRIEVTDHAVMRYMDRVLGVDIEAIRREISHKVLAARAGPKADSVVIDGMRYVLGPGDGAVLTVLDETWPCKAARRYV